MVYDEEPDERRREKFSRERGVGQQDFRRPFDRSKRSDFIANGTMKRTFRGSGIEDEQQPPKRGRFDSAADSYEPVFNRRDPALDSDGGTTTLLTFRKFLATQDESLSDEEAISKYNEYKFEVLRQECERYFQKHKEEEWFRLKYHPEDGRAGREEHRSNIQKRLEIFNEFLENGTFDNVQLDFSHTERLIRIMDAVIVKLEGGTSADIDAIKNEPIEDESLQDLMRGKESENDKVPQETEATIAVPISSEGEESSKQQNENKNAKTSDEEGGATAEEETKKLAMPLHHQLHKTCSVYFRSVPADASVADLENLCKQHPGFLRLAIGNPVSDSRGVRARPAWATYRKGVNIREIYWSLRRAKLVASDLGTLVNRDLKRRVRVSGVDSVPANTTLSVFTSPIDSHRTVAANSLRQAARLIVLLDVREGVYREEAEDGEEEGGKSFDPLELKGVDGLDEAVLNSRNPILAGIGDYMVEEASVEEDALLERSAAADGGTVLEISQQHEQDRALLKVLDQMLFYLRIVHSVDFYAAVHYPQEDRMPSRLGLFHVRRILPAMEKMKRAPQLAKSVVDGHVEGFNARLENGLFKQCTPLSERELQKLDKKDAEKAVDLFISANTQQLGPEKWLCPLSGKKFKGPEFVHKHINTKYKEEVDKVRNEALYYNNFIADPKRPHSPQLFEQPKTRIESRQSSESGADPQHISPHTDSLTDRTQFQRSASSWGAGGNYGVDRFGGSSRYSGAPRPAINTGGWRRMEPMNETTVRGVNGGGGGAMRDPRAPPSYKDLDAPTEDII